MTPDEALDRLDSTYHSPLLAVVRAEVEALRHDIARHVQISAEQAQELEELRADLAAARARVAELDETWTDETGEVWTRPTAFAYDMTCRALREQRERADKAEADLAAARALLREAYVAMREPTGEWHDIKCNTVLPKIHAALAEGKK